MPEPYPKEALAMNVHRKTILGKKLDNPYALANMQKAMEVLLSRRKTTDAGVLKPTDYYVRFFLDNSVAWERLNADSLALFDYPLDYEIDSVGNYMGDTDPMQGKWVYTSVPVSYQFPDIVYEVLEELYLPEHANNENERIGIELREDLEAIAFQLTGNAWQSADFGAKQAIPSGYVRVWDTERQQLVGVEGVKVRTRRWFSYGEGHTNQNGYYVIDRGYSNDVHYTVFFENISGFHIWSSILDLSVASHHVGDHSPNGYNIDIYQNSRAWPFATVNNATVKYRRYAQSLGVGLPPSNLRIAATDGTGASSAPMLRRTWGVYGFTSESDLLAFLWKANGISLSANALATLIKFALPDVIISANSARGTAAVYTTVFHEMGHGSHYAKVGNGYWIRYINYIITYGSYGDGLGNNAGLCALGEAWGNHVGYTLAGEEFKNVPLPSGISGSIQDNSYARYNVLDSFRPLARVSGTDGGIYRLGTPINSLWGWIPAGIMRDLADDTPNELISNDANSFLFDNASGYTLQEFYEALDSDVDSPQKFRDRLLSENANKDEADVRSLFEVYLWK